MLAKNAIDEVFDYVKSDVDPKVWQDYIAFFTTEKGADMLPYAYMESSEHYDDLIKNCADYYLFNDEVFIIKDNKAKLSQYFAGIKNVVEIGPGSYYAVEHKTLPLLSCVNNVQNYCAIDISPNYLDEACSYVRNHTSGLNVSGLEADLLQPSPLRITQLEGNKVVMFLGSTLGNFNDQQQQHIIKQIANLTSHGDKLVLTIDVNQDEESVLKAYSNIYAHRLVEGVLEYFAGISEQFSQYVDSFEVKTKWNQNTSRVEMYFVAKRNITFDIRHFGTITLKAGQELYGTRSNKYDPKAVTALLKKNGFELLDSLRHNQIYMLVCQRVRK